MDFEDAMRHLRIAPGVTLEEIVGIREAILALASNVGTERPFFGVCDELNEIIAEGEAS